MFCSFLFEGDHPNFIDIIHILCYWTLWRSVGFGVEDHHRQESWSWGLQRAALTYSLSKKSWSNKSFYFWFCCQKKKKKRKTWHCWRAQKLTKLLFLITPSHKICSHSLLESTQPVGIVFTLWHPSKPIVWFLQNSTGEVCKSILESPFLLSHLYTSW